MSESLLLINPRRRKKKSRKGRMPAGLKRYWAARRGGTVKRRKRRKTARVRRRRAVSVAAAPRRRRRHHIKHRRRSVAPNPRRRVHRRRHTYQNPFRIGGIVGTLKSSLVPASVGATGAIALDVAMAYASPYLPASLQSGYVATLVKLAGALGVGMLAGKVLGRQKGQIAMLGGMTVVAYGAIKPLIAGFAPTVKGLSGYTDFVDYSVGRKPAGVGAYIPKLGYYSPAPVIGGGMGAYIKPGMSGLGDASGYDWRSDGM